MSNYGGKLADAAFQVLGGGGSDSGGDGKPAGLTDVFPAQRTLATSLVRVAVPDSAEWDSSTRPAFATARDQGQCVWIPLLFVEPGNNFPDEALVYSVTCRLGPADYNGTGSSTNFANGAKAWGTATGLGAAVVVAKRNQGIRSGPNDRNHIIGNSFIAHAPIDGLNELSAPTLPVGSNFARQTRNTDSKDTRVFDWWRPPAWDAGGLGIAETSTRVYSPGGVRLRKGEVFGAWLVMDLQHVDRAVSSNAGKCFAAQIDIWVRVMLRADDNQLEL